MDKNTLPKLPRGWVWTKLENICIHKKGKKPKSAILKRKEGYFPYILIDQLEGKEPKLFTNDKNCPICTKEDVLMVWDGSIGKSAIGIEGAIGSTIVALTPIGIVPKYLKYFIQFNRPIIQSKSRGTGLQHVNPEFFWNLPFILPPFHEQRRIVAKIEELFTKLDAGVEVLKKARAQLKRCRQAVLKHAFEGKLTSSDVENWKWVKTGEIMETINNGYTPKSDKMNIGKGEIPFIKVYNLTFNGELDFTKSPTFIDKKTHTKDLKRSITYPNDVLINIVGPPLGKVSVVPNTFPEWNINQAIVLFRPNDKITAKFLSYFLQNPSTIQWLIKTSKATAGQYNVKVTTCREIPIPQVSINEQGRIVEEIERRLSVADETKKIVEQEILQAERLCQSILKRAFEGKLVPQDPSDEPAEKLLERIKAEKAKQGAERKNKRMARSKTIRKKRRRSK